MDGDDWSSAYQRQWRTLVTAGLEAVVRVLTLMLPDTAALEADSPFDDTTDSELFETAYSR